MDKAQNNNFKKVLYHHQRFQLNLHFTLQVHAYIGAISISIDINATNILFKINLIQFPLTLKAVFDTPPVTVAAPAKA
jgi:hypothetical protein